MPPEVSVVMAVYNGAARLRQAVECILTQTCDDLEFIVIDDGSTDDTSSILDTYTDPRIVRLKNDTNLGLTQSLNKGLATATGEFIARQDCDDYSYPSRLTKQVTHLNANHSIILQGTAAREVGESGEDFGRLSHPRTDTTIRWKMLLHNSFVHSSVMLRRETLCKHKLKYDPQLSYSQDFDLWSRLMFYGHVANLSETLIDLHLHRGQITRIAWESQQRTADHISRRNIRTMGLDISITDDELEILRQRAGKRVARERWHRIREGQLLFRLLQAYEAQMGQIDEEWRLVRKEQLHYIRQCLALVSTNPPLLANQLRLASYDPVGLLQDLAHKFRRSFQSPEDK